MFHRFITFHTHEIIVTKARELKYFIISSGVIGKAGVDFPALPNIPNTGFNCKNVPTGYYADLETDCQVSDLIILNKLMYRKL